MGYGGNTPCVEIRHMGDPPIIIDGGTGIRWLGQKLAKEFEPGSGEVNLFLTHFHYDHIQGIPFFGSLYHPLIRVNFYASVPAGQLERNLGEQVRSPYFPVRMPAVENHYYEVPPGGVTLGAVRVLPVPLKHPDPVTGYRVETPHGVIVYGSDHEHGLPEYDEGLARAAQGADILIYDAHFTPEEYPNFKGWGHSTWLEATRIAKQAGVGKLFLFHHAPDHNDEEMARIEQEARKHFPAVAAAREGLTVEV